MRPTRRGIAILVVAILLVAFGQWAGFPLLRGLGAVLLAAVLTAVVVTLRRVRVSVTRSVFPDRVERGKSALARLKVRNLTEARQPPFLATDGDETVRIRALPPKAEATYHYELTTRTRGKLQVGPLQLHRVDPFGLATNRLPTGDSTTLWVYPRQYPARPLLGAHPRHHHEGATTDDPLRGSMDLRDVREYVPGDEVRHLHWKATARTGRLMVRDLVDPQQPRFTVLLDTRESSYAPEFFEEAVDLAASLLSASARADQHTRLVTSSGLDVPTAGGNEAARSLLDELCLVQQHDDDSVVPKALAASRGFGGCLVLVTSTDAELTSLSWMRRRYSEIIVFAMGIGGGTTQDVAGARVFATHTAEHAVRRWNEVIG